MRLVKNFNRSLGLFLGSLLVLSCNGPGVATPSSSTSGLSPSDASLLYASKEGDTVSGELNLTSNLNLVSTSATAGQITQNGTPLIHTYGTNNFFAGTGAGNFTLTVGSATDSTGVGNGAVSSLTTGYGNAFGSGTACVF